MSDIPLQDQLAELKRERNMRAKVYPNWVRTNRLKAEEVKEQTDRLNAAIATIEGLIQGRMAV